MGNTKSPEKLYDVVLSGRALDRIMESLQDSIKLNAMVGKREECPEGLRKDTLFLERLAEYLDSLETE